jgi:hypothetical protein
MAHSLDAATVPLRNLPQRAYDDIIDLIYNRTVILAIVTKSASLPPAGSMIHFSSLIGAQLGLDPTVVSVVTNALWNIKNLQSTLELDGKKTLNALAKALKIRARRFQETHLADWDETVPILAEALDSLNDDHPLLISAKAGVLAYTHERLVMSSRLLTDARPVFNTAGDQVVEVVITHTLAVRFSDGSTDSKLLTFAMDQEDVVSLRKECERAEHKARVVSAALKDLNPVILPEISRPSRGSGS